MWLIQPETLQAMEHGRQTSLDQPSINAFFDDDDKDSRGPRGLKKIGDRAEVAVEGVLTQGRNILAMLFGGGNTTYGDIIAGIQDADADTNIREIRLNVDSPGGSVDGLFDAVAAVQAAETRVVANVGNKAASAAFILSAVADEVVASNPVSSVGSFGVAVEANIPEGSVTITNSESPDKRPDLTTEEGQSVVREHLDAIHAIFREAVATGRGVTEDTVSSKFGSGRVFVASEAVKRGMIDRVEQPRLRAVNPTSTSTAQAGGEKPEATMDLAKLKAEHPDLHASVLQEGINQERERVKSHLILGEQSGDMKTASEAIQNGDELTASLQAKYMAAGMRKHEVDARQQESDGVEGAAQAAATASEQEGTDYNAQVLAALESDEIPGV